MIKKVMMGMISIIGYGLNKIQKITTLLSKIGLRLLSFSMYYSGRIAELLFPSVLKTEC
jgi:hypothetical protein